MNEWQVPPGVSGTAWLARASSVITREDERDCPRAASVKMRPQLVPISDRPRGYTPLIDFPFAPLIEAALLIEHDNKTLDWVLGELHRTHGRFGRRGAPGHPALLEWTAEALPRYLAARAAVESGRLPGIAARRTSAVRQEWVASYTTREGLPDARGISRFEQTAWGLRYQSTDGRYRDLWLPSKATAGTDRPAAELAAVAYVLATGEEGPRPWSRSFIPSDRQLPRPERVRVFAYGCIQGEPRLLLDWDQEETRRQYLEHAAPALRRASLGAETRPGTDCVGCKALNGCTALPRTPGLWRGAPSGTPRPRRSLSAWDLRVHRECPAKYHLTRQLGIKAALPETDATVRGRLVDRALELRHRAQPARHCREAPRPADAADWSADGIRLTGEAAREAAAMLAQHDALCPLGGLGPRDLVRPVHQLTSYVPELDVVVVATPDLLYTRGDAWYWRETKTSTSRLYDGRPLMRQYPQLALAVLLMNAQVPDGDLRRSRVEFELLHTDDCVLEVLDPSRPAVVAEARELVAELAEPLLSDAVFDPSPGRHCRDCAARSWCGPGREHPTEHPKPAADPAAAQDG